MRHAHRPCVDLWRWQWSSSTRSVEAWECLSHGDEHPDWPCLDHLGTISVFFNQKCSKESPAGSGVQEIVLIDIDPAVCRAARRFLLPQAFALSDARASWDCRRQACYDKRGPPNRAWAVLELGQTHTWTCLPHVLGEGPPQASPSPTFSEGSWSPRAKDPAFLEAWFV